jgi:hypothetical protein
MPYLSITRMIQEKSRKIKSSYFDRDDLRKILSVIKEHSSFETNKELESFIS